MTKIKTKQRTVPEQEPFDYASFESEAIKRLYEGDGLVGAQGILTNLIQRLVNAALSGEMVGHLKEQRSLARPTVATGTRPRPLTRIWGLSKYRPHGKGQAISSRNWCSLWPELCNGVIS